MSVGFPTRCCPKLARRLPGGGAGYRRAVASRFAQLTIDADNVPVVAQFWAEVLGYRPVIGEDGSAKLYPPDRAPADAATVWIRHTTDKKQSKNRAHPDLRPPDDDVDG